MATITDRSGSVDTTPVRDLHDKDKTLVVDRVETNSSPRGIAVPVVHRTRASAVATMALVIGVVAAGAVATGVLAGPGVALGILAAFLGLGGMAATSRPYVAGKGDALLGMFFGLAAVVVGVLALTGTLSWLSDETNTVTQLGEWLSARVPWLFPS